MLAVALALVPGVLSIFSCQRMRKETPLATRSRCPSTLRNEFSPRRMEEGETKEEASVEGRDQGQERRKADSCGCHLPGPCYPLRVGVLSQIGTIQEAQLHLLEQRLGTCQSGRAQLHPSWRSRLSLIRKLLPKAGLDPD